LKTNDEWLRSTSSGIASTDDFRNVVSGGSKYRSKGINEDAGTVEHFIKRAQSPIQAAASALNKLASEMSSQGSDFATMLGYEVDKVSGGYKITKGGQSVTVEQSSKPIIDFIKADITNEELLEFYNRGVLGEGVEGELND
jgi:hypothetical protein